MSLLGFSIIFFPFFSSHWLQPSGLFFVFPSLINRVGRNKKAMLPSAGIPASTTYGRSNAGRGRLHTGRPINKVTPLFSINRHHLLRTVPTDNSAQCGADKPQRYQGTAFNNNRLYIELDLLTVDRSQIGIR